jgi:hypothetical protein
MCSISGSRQPVADRALLNSDRGFERYVQDADTKTERLALENRLALECTQPWVTAPRALLLAGGSRTFEVICTLSVPGK